MAEPQLSNLGNISAPSQKLNEVLNQRKVVLELVQGKDLQGNEQYAYVLLKKTELPSFKKALSESDVKLSDYGVVIAAGKGKPPSGIEAELIESILKNE